MGSKSKKRRLEARAARAEARQAAEAGRQAGAAAPPEQENGPELAGHESSPSPSPVPQPAVHAPPPKKKKKTSAATPPAVQPANGSPAPLSSPAASARLPSAHKAAATLSLAVPGSILDSVVSHEAAAAVAGQIARAASIFGAEEVVVYDDSPSTSGQWDGTVSVGTAALAKLLQYLETPPYLRGSLMPQVRLQHMDSLCYSCCCLVKCVVHGQGGRREVCRTDAEGHRYQCTEKHDFISMLHVACTFGNIGAPLVTAMWTTFVFSRLSAFCVGLQSDEAPELRAVEAICPTVHALHHLRGQEWRPYREGVVMRSEPGM